MDENSHSQRVSARGTCAPDARRTCFEQQAASILVTRRVTRRCLGFALTSPCRTDAKKTCRNVRRIQTTSKLQVARIKLRRAYKLVGTHFLAQIPSSPPSHPIRRCGDNPGLRAAFEIVAGESFGEGERERTRGREGEEERGEGARERGREKAGCSLLTSGALTVQTVCCTCSIASRLMYGQPAPAGCQARSDGAKLDHVR